MNNPSNDPFYPPAPANAYPDPILCNNKHISSSGVIHCCKPPDHAGCCLGFVEGVRVVWGGNNPDPTPGHLPEGGAEKLFQNVFNPSTTNYPRGKQLDDVFRRVMRPDWADGSVSNPGSFEEYPEDLQMQLEKVATIILGLDPPVGEHDPSFSSAHVEYVTGPGMYSEPLTPYQEDTRKAVEEMGKDLLRQAADEIKSLRRRVDIQAAKIEGFETAASLVFARPPEQTPQPCGVDILWEIEKFIAP